MISLLIILVNMISFLVILEFIKFWRKHLLLFHFLRVFTSQGIRRVVCKYSGMYDSMSVSFYFLSICCCCMFLSISDLLTAGRVEDLSRGRKNTFSLPIVVFVIKHKFVCPAHSEARHTKLLEFGAEKGLLQGQVRRMGGLCSCLETPKSLRVLVKHLFCFPFIFISWRLITLQYCTGFCHTLT